MISEDRQKHIISVARLMKEYCVKHGFDDEYAEDMFYLGILHDIGYEFGDNVSHMEVGGNILKRQNYKYYNEVMYHGNPNCEYSSKELDLLNWADMHIDGKGNFVTFDERLKDIANRRGKDSMAYVNSKFIIKDLINKNFN